MIPASPSPYATYSARRSRARHQARQATDEDDREDDPEQRHRDADDRRVFARGDGLAALDRSACRRLAEEPDRRAGTSRSRDRPPPGRSVRRRTVPRRRPRSRRSLTRRWPPRPRSMSAPSVCDAPEPDDRLAVEPHRRVAFTPAASAAPVSARAAACSCPVATHAFQAVTSRPAALAIDGQPGRREGALVLAVLVREDPVLERPVAVLIRGTACAGRGLDRLVVRRSCSSRPGTPRRGGRSGACRASRTC